MIFFLQMFVILAACRLCGCLVRRSLRQPQVIGEMIAGVVLGSSLLGAVAPDIQHFLLVGLDFRADDFKANVRGAVSVSLSGIIVPFIVAIPAMLSRGALSPSCSRAWDPTRASHSSRSCAARSFRPCSSSWARASSRRSAAWPSASTPRASR